MLLRICFRRAVTYVELKRRFNSETSIIVSGVQSLKPESKSFLDMTAIQSVGKLSHCNREFLKYEVHQLKRLLQHKNLSLSSMRELEVFFHPYHEAFPEIHKLLFYDRACYHCAGRAKLLQIACREDLLTKSHVFAKAQQSRDSVD